MERARKKYPEEWNLYVKKLALAAIKGEDISKFTDSLDRSIKENAEVWQMLAHVLPVLPFVPLTEDDLANGYNDDTRSEGELYRTGK